MKNDAAGGDPLCPAYLRSPFRGYLTNGQSNAAGRDGILQNEVAWNSGYDRKKRTGFGAGVIVAARSRPGAYWLAGDALRRHARSISQYGHSAGFAERCGPR